MKKLIILSLLLSLTLVGCQNPNPEFGGIKEEIEAKPYLKLKADKSKIITSKEVNDIRLDGKGATDYGKVIQYFYITSKKEPGKFDFYKGKYTNIKVISESNGAKTVEMHSRDKYSQESDGVYEVSVATTTPEAFAEQTKLTLLEQVKRFFIGEEVLADTFYAGTGNGDVLSGSSATWSTVHDATAGASIYNDGGENGYVGYEHYPNYLNHRMFFPFDTSALGAGATVSAVDACFQGGTLHNDCNATSDWLGVVESTQADPTDLVVEDYDAIAGWGSYPVAEMHETSERIDYDSWNQSGYNCYTFNATGIASIEVTNWSKYSLMSGWDSQNSAYCSGSNVYSQNIVYTAQSATDPYLLITYTPGATAKAVLNNDIIIFE